MITYDDYKSHLNRVGRNLGEVRKNRSDDIMNATFTGDVAYRKVYILDPTDGWKYVDARYTRHAIPSMARQQVDYYLQFRPQEHYPVGTYVFIPDDTSYDMNVLEEDPLHGDVSNLWLVVGRDNVSQFVRYMVIKVNWNFKWVYGYGDHKKVYSCWGASRHANSYTSGVWNDFYTTGLDNLTGFYLPNTHHVFGDEGLKKYGLEDTRLITISQRTMITLNEIHPSCYKVTKVLDMNPQGVLILSLKQDEFDPKRDSIPLLLCDYFGDTGNVIIEDDRPSPSGTGEIKRMIINNDGELEPSNDTSALHIGETYYFSTELNNPQWVLMLMNADDLSDSERIAIERLVRMTNVTDNTITLKPGKSMKLYGRHFTLNVRDNDGNNMAYIELEVADET